MLCMLSFKSWHVVHVFNIFGCMFTHSVQKRATAVWIRRDVALGLGSCGDLPM